MANWNIINLKDIKPDRFDADFFKKDYRENINSLIKTGDVQPLGRLFKKIGRGSQPYYSEKGTIKALRSVNVGFMDFNETRQEYVTSHFFETNARGRVQKDDILITSTGVGTLGRTSIWHYDEKAFCDGHITILRDSVVDPYLITAYLNSKYGLIQFDQNYRGSSGQIEIYPYDISKILIPTVLFEHQKEIADLLRKAFNLKNDSEVNLQKARDLLDKELGLNKKNYVNRKKFVTSFSDVITSKRGDAEFHNPGLRSYYKYFSSEKKLDLKPITQFAKILKFSNPDYSVTGTPIITQRHLTNISPENYGDFPIASDEWVSKNPEAIIRENDLLFYSVGAYLGKTNIWFNQDQAVHASFITMLRCADEIDAGYLMVLLNSTYGLLQSKVFQSGTSQPYIYPKDIKQFQIPDVSKDLKSELYFLIKESYNAKKESQRLLQNAIDRVEQLIENASQNN